MSPPPYIGGVGNQVIIHPLREEVVTSLKSVREVIQRGEANRRTASTDWNERSSRSHSVFRLVVESRERGSPDDTAEEEERKVSWECCIWVPSVHTTHAQYNAVPQTPGGSRLQAKGGRSVRTSVLVILYLPIMRC